VFHVDRHLDDAKKGFTAISLSLLANYRKRQQLTALLKSLHTIKTLVRLVRLVSFHRRKLLMWLTKQRVCRDYVVVTLHIYNVLHFIRNGNIKLGVYNICTYWYSG